RVVHRLCYPCADGFVTLGIMGGGAPAYVASSRHVVEWMPTEKAAPPWLEHLDWATDYDASALDQDLVDRVEATVGAFLARKPKETIYRAAVERGFLAAPINTVADILASEQLRARDYWVQPTGDPASLRFCGPALRASGTPLTVRPP